MLTKNKTKIGFLSILVLSSSFFSTSYAQRSVTKLVTKPAISKTVVINDPNGSRPTFQQGAQQTAPIGPKFSTCATDVLMQNYITENHLEAVYAQEQVNRQNTSSIQDYDRAVKIVPVVFHVVYPNTTTGTTMNTKISTAVINT